MLHYYVHSIRTEGNTPGWKREGKRKKDGSIGNCRSFYQNLAHLASDLSFSSADSPLYRPIATKEESQRIEHILRTTVLTTNKFVPVARQRSARAPPIKAEELPCN